MALVPPRRKHPTRASCASLGISFLALIGLMSVACGRNVPAPRSFEVVQRFSKSTATGSRVRAGRAKDSCSDRLYPGGRGRVEPRPKKGAVGSVIQLTGRCFAREPWKTLQGRARQHGIALLQARERCELMAPARGYFRVNRQGRLRGWFRVPARGFCVREGSYRRVSARRYSIVFACPACAVGHFRVIKQPHR